MAAAAATLIDTQLDGQHIVYIYSVAATSAADTTTIVVGEPVAGPILTPEIDGMQEDDTVVITRTDFSDSLAFTWGAATATRTLRIHCGPSNKVDELV